jgi:hypothetical protein
MEIEGRVEQVIDCLGWDRTSPSSSGLTKVSSVSSSSRDIADGFELD